MQMSTQDLAYSPTHTTAQWVEPDNAHVTVHGGASVDRITLATQHVAN